MLQPFLGSLNPSLHSSSATLSRRFQRRQRVVICRLRNGNWGGCCRAGIVMTQYYGREKEMRFVILARHEKQLLGGPARRGGATIPAGR